MSEIKALNNLVDSFSKLPGVGIRTAERLAYAILDMKDEDAFAFSNAIVEVKNTIHPCSSCGLYATEEKCDICNDSSRDHKTFCVVANAKDALAIEKTKTFHGLYHVLGGLISMNRGIGPDDLQISRLLKRLKNEEAKEVILAFNPTIEGETTTLYLAKILEKENIQVTRLAYGLSMGTSLEYADGMTLEKAFEGRRKP